MVENLASLHFPMKFKDVNGNEQGAVVQGHLQPVELWSYVFPEEHLDTVLRTLNPVSQIGFDMPKGHPGHETAAPKRKWSLALLRKGLGLDPIPEYQKDGLKFPIWMNNMQIVGLGVKKDYKNQYGNEAL